MAIRDLRVKENIPGSFFVDQNCIACCLCAKELPRIFRMNETMHNAYVFNMPKTAKDLEDFMEVQELCPVGSIGSN